MIDLSDGRKVAVPLAWSARLLHATPERRGGEHVHRPDIDDDLSVEGPLAVRARRAPVL